MGATLTTSQDQTGITTKSKKTASKLNTHWREKPYNKGQTETTPPNKTGRECRGVRGLVGLLQAAAEVPEGYFSHRRALLEVSGQDPKRGPHPKNQNWERNPDNLRL